MIELFNPFTFNEVVRFTLAILLVVLYMAHMFCSSVSPLLLTFTLSGQEELMFSVCSQVVFEPLWL